MPITLPAFDPVQALLMLVISTLTILLAIVGIQIIKILGEFRKSLQKINKILDDGGRISQAIAQPIEQASSFIVGLKKGFSLFQTITDFIQRLRGKKSQPDEKGVADSQPDQAEEEPETDQAEGESQPKPVKKKSNKSQKKKTQKKTRKKRFFTKNGRSLKKKAA